MGNAGGALGVAACEVVAAGFAVELAGGEHVPAAGDDRVLDGAERAPVAADAGTARRGRRFCCESPPSPPRSTRCRATWSSDGSCRSVVLPAERSLPGHWPAQEARS